MILSFIALSVAALSAMNEIDKIIGAEQIGNASYGAAQLFAPLSMPNRWSTAFTDWATVSCTVPIQSWLIIYLGIDVIFIAGYCGLLRGIDIRWNIVGTQWIVALVAIDLTEDMLAATATTALPGSASCGVLVWSPPFWLISIASMAKWATTIVVAIRIIYGASRRPNASLISRRLGIAFKMQRFSLIVVGILAALMITPGQDIFDQVTDIQRSWLLTEQHVTGAMHIVAAALTFAVLASLLKYLSKVRAIRALMAYGGRDTERPDSHSSLWLATSGGLILIAVLLQVLGLADVAWWSLVGAAAIPVVVVVVNFAVEHWTSDRKLSARPQDPPVVPVVRLVGDLLAVTVLSLLGIGLVRSFVGPLLIGDQWGTSAAAIVVGLGISVGVWHVALPILKAQLIEEPAGAPSPAGFVDSMAAGPWWWNRRLATAGLGTAALTAPLLFFPAFLGRILGVLGILALGLSILTLVFTALAIAAQRRVPLQLFRIMGLRATPMITLVLLAGIAASLLDPTSDLHAARAPIDSAATSAARTQWESSGFTDGVLKQAPRSGSVEQWLDSPLTAQCAKPVDQQIGGREVQVMPMLLVGATGGGIRAAWWTVGTMTAFKNDPCAAHSVLAASGASGGSIGLGVMLAAADPIAAIGSMADPAPLAEAADGLIVRDIAAGFTGINAAVAGTAAGDRFPDRAGLLEQSWERQVPELTSPFPLPPAAAGGPLPGQAQVPWRTFFNSTSAPTGCRVIIGDVRIRPVGPNGPESTDCGVTDSSPGVPGSYSLFAAKPCLVGTRVSTAMLLSSRFPYVTPSGLVRGSCDQSDQLIDGGYAENSGIGTIDELSSDVMPLVRAHNAASLAGTGPINLVVPVVVSVENTPRVSRRTATKAQAVPEALVPIVGGLRRGATLSDTDSLIERTQNSTADWLPCATTTCAAQFAAINELLDDRAVIVAPAQAPQIAAPLGWVLSEASRASLNNSLDAQKRCQTDSPTMDCAFGRLLARVSSD